MKKYIQISLTILVTGSIIASSLVSCIDGKSEAVKLVRKSDPIPVRIIEMKLSDESTPILSSGKITTDNETLLAFKTGGVLDQVFVQEGDKIRKGQVLATIDQREINALVSQARLLLEKGERDFQRVKSLYVDSVATLEQMQNAKTALDVAKQQVQAAEFNKQYSKIIAPQNGFVLRKFANPGQVIGIGDPILMVNGVSNKGWILKVNASDKQWSAIELNDKALVKLDAFGDKEFEAKVLRKSEASDLQTGTFSIDLLVRNGHERLAAGMFGSAQITTGNSAKGWSVPYEAVLDADGNQGFVFLTADYKTAVKKPVTIGAMENNRIIITGGVEDFPAIIVSGSAYLTDKSEIAIIK